MCKYKEYTFIYEDGTSEIKSFKSKASMEKYLKDQESENNKYLDYYTVF